MHRGLVVGITMAALIAGCGGGETSAYDDVDASTRTVSIVCGEAGTPGDEYESESDCLDFEVQRDEGLWLPSNSSDALLMIGTGRDCSVTNSGYECVVGDSLGDVTFSFEMGEKDASGDWRRIKDFDFG